MAFHLKGAIHDKTDVDLKIRMIHARVNDVRIAPLSLTEDKVNGYEIPARGESEYGIWIVFPVEIANRPREFVLSFELATPGNVRRKEVVYAY